MLMHQELGDKSQVVAGMLRSQVYKPSGRSVVHPDSAALLYISFATYRALQPSAGTGIRGALQSQALSPRHQLTPCRARTQLQPRCCFQLQPLLLRWRPPDGCWALAEAPSHPRPRRAAAQALLQRSLPQRILPGALPGDGAMAEAQPAASKQLQAMVVSERQSTT